MVDGLLPLDGVPLEPQATASSAGLQRDRDGLPPGKPDCRDSPHVLPPPIVSASAAGLTRRGYLGG